MANAAIFALYLGITKPGLLPKVTREGRVTFWIGGSASFIAYGLVMWAFTQAPIALVTALRETSIIFALAIGILFLKEKIDVPKVFSTFTTLLGAFLLRFSKG